MKSADNYKEPEENQTSDNVNDLIEEDDTPFYPVRKRETIVPYCERKNWDSACGN